MTLLMKILRIHLKQQLPSKSYMIKHLILLKVKNMMDIKEFLLQRFVNFLIRSSLPFGGVKNKHMSKQELAKELY